MALLFVVPRTRSWARWPLAVTGVGSVVAVFLARQSGMALASVAVHPGDVIGPLIARHAQLAGQLQIMTAVLAVLAGVNAVVGGRGGGTAERRGGRGGGPLLDGLHRARAGGRALLGS